MQATSNSSFGAEWVGVQGVLASVANITFMQANGVGDISIGRVRFGSDSLLAQGSDLGIGYRPQNFPADDRNGDVWFDSSRTSNADQYFSGPGSNGYWLALHELGHALGLLHPFNPHDQGNTSDWNSWRYSIMSYKDLDGHLYADVGKTSGDPSAPMLLDIAAIQQLYGANPNTRTGDDAYHFTKINGWPIQAIWDAGGNDTIDGSDQSANLHIDLSRLIGHPPIQRAKKSVGRVKGPEREGAMRSDLNAFG